jgi:hypothetical protein
MRIVFQAILLMVLLILPGCASKGFNREALLDQIGVQNPVTSDADIKEILSTKANLPKPFKLAVYFKQPIQKNFAKPKWRWTEHDKELVLGISEELKNEKIVSDVFLILGSLVSNDDLKSIRIAAAKHGADAVIVIDGTGEIDRYINNWGWTYLMLVTTLFVPGSESDALFMTNAAMWDVRNEYLYLTAEAEGKTQNTHIAAFGESNEQLFEKAKTTALQNLKTEVSNMIKGVKK